MKCSLASFLFLSIFFEEGEDFHLCFVSFVVDEPKGWHFFDMDSFHDIAAEAFGGGGEPVHGELGTLLGHDRDEGFGVFEIVGEFDFGDGDEPTDAWVVEPTGEPFLELLLDVGCDL